MTSIMNTTDILEHSESMSADSEFIFWYLKQVIEDMDLELGNLVGFYSDGASVMTGKENGVAAKFKKLHQL